MTTIQSDHSMRRVPMWIAGAVMYVGIAAGFVPDPVLAASPEQHGEIQLEGQAWTLADQAYQAYDSGDYRLAQTLAEQAIVLRPDVPRLRLLLVYALEKQGLLDEARRSLEDAIAKQGDISPALREAQLNLMPAAPVAAKQEIKQKSPPKNAYDRAYPIATQAYASFRQGNNDRAATLARRAFLIDPSQTPWALLWLDALGAQEKDQAALEAIREIARSGAAEDADIKARARTIERRLARLPAEESYKFLSLADYAAAADKASEAVALSPDEPNYRLLLIFALMWDEQWSAAEEAATAALDEDDEDINARVLRGYIRQMLGRSGQSFSDFDQVLSQDWIDEKQLSNIRLIAVDGALAAGDPVRAKQLLLPLDKDQAEVGFRRARLNKIAGKGATLSLVNYPLPIQDCHDTPYGTTCELLPADSAVSTSVAANAYAAYSRGDYQEAIEQARRAAVQQPDNAATQELLLTALAAGNRSQAKEALATLNRKVDKNPDDADLRMRRGYLLQRLGRPGDAVQDFRMAGSLPEAPDDALLSEAYALAGAGKKPEAVALLRNIIDRDDAGEQSLSPEKRFDTRNAIANFSRTGGATLALSYRGVQPSVSTSDGSTLSTAGDTLYSTAEVFWRPEATNNQYGYLEAYGRISGLMFDGGGEYSSSRYYSCEANAYVDSKGESDARMVSGLPSSVGSLGLRYMIADTGLMLGLERRQFLGTATRQGYVYPESAEDACDIRARLNGHFIDHYPPDMTPGQGAQWANGLSSAPIQYRMNADAGGWMAYAAYGFYKGTGLKFNENKWLTISGYIQAGYAWDDNSVEYSLLAPDGKYGLGSGRLKRQQGFVSADMKLGVSMRFPKISDKLVFFPHIGTNVDWLWQKSEAHFDALPGAGKNSFVLSNHGTDWWIGAGPGISARYWTREDHYNAPRSYVDFGVQYRFGLAGSQKKRAEGMFVYFTYYY